MTVDGRFEPLNPITRIDPYRPIYDDGDPISASFQLEILIEKI